MVACSGAIGDLQGWAVDMLNLQVISGRGDQDQLIDGVRYDVPRFAGRFGLQLVTVGHEDCTAVGWLVGCLD